MDWKIRIKNTVSRYNPLAVRRRERMRAELKNRDFSLICPNCLGGMLLHDLNMPFLSPTVNLMLNQRDFVRFVMDLPYYTQQELRFYDDPAFSCPCAKLGEPGKAVTIHFTHYPDRQSAKTSWNKRIPRINYQNLFILAAERDGLTEQEILRLGELKARGVLVFTAKKYPDIPYTCFLPDYEKDGQVGNILVRSYLNDKKDYEKYFDFVRWFNEADGAPFDVSNFIIKKG